MTRSLRLLLTIINASMAMLIAAGLPVMANEQTAFEVFRLEEPRPFDDSYQRDLVEYKRDIDSIIERLSIRAPKSVKELIGNINIRLLNRGRAEAFTSDHTVYMDIAILDLIDHSALESAISTIKSDPYHSMEFALSYSVALSADRVLHGVDPYNHANLDEEQWQTLWVDVTIHQSILFENCLAFILAHEFGHVVLEHDRKLKEEYRSVSDSKVDKSAWNKKRRQMELEADRFASELTLNALYQPANILPWFTLAGIRRHHYGKSSEYPDPGQREAVVKAVYQAWEEKGLLPADDHVELEPLPPDRDITKVDKIIGLKRLREVRDFRRNYLAIIDNQLKELLQAGYSVKDSTEAIVELTQSNKEVLGSSCEKPAYLKEIVSEIESKAQGGEIDIDKIRGLVKKACKNESKQGYLLNDLDQPDPDWQQIKTKASLMRSQRPEYADSMMWEYFLANSIFRWHPEVYREYLESANRVAGEQVNLKPYMRGKPLKSPAPSREEMKAILNKWNGSYLIK